jgi:1,4-alpha-glucan branching enzyme
MDAPRPRGDLALVLHAHLPFVRHPEHRYFLEENWLFEAITATYLPLYQVLREAADREPEARPPSVRVTMSLSPPLCSMLRDPLLRERYKAYLLRLCLLGEEEIARSGDQPEIRHLAEFYLARFTALRELYDDLKGDLVAAYAGLQDRGVVEILTSCATHAFLPVLHEPAARRAQLVVAVRHYRDCFGRFPRGIWLPECGYTEGVDQLLSELDLRYFFLDAHGLTYARPRPPLGLHAPIFTRAGVAAFGRDLLSSKQVWSATEGYPGDGVYRDFYRDIGFDRPLSVIAPFIHPDGIRVHTGYKYHRVTGPRVDLADKALYDPAAALARAREHAADFVHKREQQILWLTQRMSRRPIIVSPYDAELLGHWWFEGPEFLREVLRLCAEPGSIVSARTASDYLADFPVNAVCEPAPSSWGEGGYSAVWIDGSNDWIYRHVHRAETQLCELVRTHQSPSDLARRALNQLLRELLLAQSSDWAFIMKTGTAVRYATDRVKSHLTRFHRLARELETDTIDSDWLTDLESRDNIFPDIDYKVYAS